MIIVSHHEKCAGVPVDGRLTHKCDCNQAPMTTKARAALAEFLGSLARESLEVGEDPEYFAVRLELLAEQIAQDARNVRRNAKLSNRTTHRLAKGAK